MTLVLRCRGEVWYKPHRHTRPAAHGRGALPRPGVPAGHGCRGIMSVISSTACAQTARAPPSPVAVVAVVIAYLLAPTLLEDASAPLGGAWTRDQPTTPAPAGDGSSPRCENLVRGRPRGGGARGGGGLRAGAPDGVRSAAFGAGLVTASSATTVLVAAHVFRVAPAAAACLAACCPCSRCSWPVSCS
ncbi:hypothetical protein QJS66_00240 [Kocuria rhizophila]|nr:hypothetical protein QJS66_00240 [Kocuria rhizophila]